MTENISIDQIIWQIHPDYRWTKDEFSRIIHDLVKSLSDYLQQPIEILDETLQASIVDEESFCCSICSGTYLGGPLAVAWEGRLGMEPINGKPSVSASLFLFSQNKRLSVVNQEGSYIELVYEMSEGDNGSWRSLGWLEDIYGEYKGIDEYSCELPISLAQT